MVMEEVGEVVVEEVDKADKVNKDKVDEDKDFWDIFRFSGNFQIFGKMFRFSENFQIFGKFVWGNFQICQEKFSDLSGKIFRFVRKNFQICP